MNTCHSTFVQIHRVHHTKDKAYVNYGLRIIMKSQVGVSVVPNGPLWRKMLIVGEVVSTWGQGVFGNNFLNLL